jgi:drug/metabolite transporter (DMT)-like permease
MEPVQNKSRKLVASVAQLVEQLTLNQLVLGSSPSRGTNFAREIALVNYLWPSLTILFSLTLLKKRASVWLVPGTALALAGVFLVMTQGARVSWAAFADHLQGNPVAYALALAAAISWALYSNLTRRWSEPESEGAVELFIPATGVMLLALRLLTTETTAWSLKALGEAWGLAAVTTLAYLLWDASIRKGNVLLVFTCSYFTPLLSTVVSCVYLRVSPSPKLWIGCLLLLSGSLISWRSVSNRPVPATAFGARQQPSKDPEPDSA